MKYLYLAPLVIFLLITSCRKKENIPGIAPKPKVQVQTEYRLQRVYGDSGKTFQTYSYNDNKLVKTVTRVHYVMAFHYTVPDTNYSSNFYEYDDQWRITRTANMPIAQAKEYSTFTYDNNLRPSARSSSKYTHALEQYTYDGDKLVERKYYDIKGQLYFTENWTYNNDGNANKYARVYATPSQGKIEITYHEYDKRHALRFAMPGIQDILVMGDSEKAVSSVSVNNATKYERTYTTNSSSYTQMIEVAYEYNSSGFPTKMTTKSTQNGATTTSIPVYFEYNK